MDPNLGVEPLAIFASFAVKGQGSVVGDLGKRLEAIVGAEHVLTGEGARPYTVDGVVPPAAAFPGSVEEVSAVLATCHDAGAAVVPWGGGTHMGLGGVPKRVDVVLALGRLNRVLEHEPGDMTSTVQAGMPLAAYQAQLGRHGQFLSLESPRPDRASIGGILAANVSGPRRLRYGAARDLLIGLRVVGADGTVTKGGAKVVKNVTGYDMNKLYVGSFGTLGVIVEATFRLYPLPAAERTWIGAFPTPAEARAAIAKILDSPIVPSAVELLSETAADVMGGRSGMPAGLRGVLLAVAVASASEAVEAQLQTVRAFGRDAGAGNGFCLEGPVQEDFWRAVRDYDPGDGGAMVLKASVLIANVGDALERGERLAADRGLRVAVIAEAGTGIVRYHFWAEDVAEDRVSRLAEVVGPLREFAATARGSLVILKAPLEVKAKVDAWGPSGQGFALMQGLKEQFDPRRILNPGRFVGGL